MVCQHASHMKAHWCYYCPVTTDREAAGLAEATGSYYEPRGVEIKAGISIKQRWLERGPNSGPVSKDRINNDHR